jgi:hypothetical protein
MVAAAERRLGAMLREAAKAGGAHTPLVEGGARRGNRRRRGAIISMYGEPASPPTDGSPTEPGGGPEGGEDAPDRRKVELLRRRFPKCTDMQVVESLRIYHGDTHRAGVVCERFARENEFGSASRLTMAELEGMRIDELQALAREHRIMVGGSAVQMRHWLAALFGVTPDILVRLEWVLDAALAAGLPSIDRAGVSLIRSHVASGRFTASHYISMYTDRIRAPAAMAEEEEEGVGAASPASSPHLAGRGTVREGVAVAAAAPPPPAQREVQKSGAGSRQLGAPTPQLRRGVYGSLCRARVGSASSLRERLQFASRLRRRSDRTSGGSGNTGAGAGGSTGTSVAVGLQRRRRDRRQQQSDFDLGATAGWTTSLRASPASCWQRASQQLIPGAAAHHHTGRRLPATPGTGGGDGDGGGRLVRVPAALRAGSAEEVEAERQRQQLLLSTALGGRACEWRRWRAAHAWREAAASRVGQAVAAQISTKGLLLDEAQRMASRATLFDTLAGGAPPAGVPPVTRPPDTPPMMRPS